jgi:NTP pyrophosphatase (non-canonical NTP hydrolase)
MTPRQLLRRAEQEMGELRRALIAGESPERIDEECGDVANFLGMLMTNYREIVADAAPHPETPR